MKVGSRHPLSCLHWILKIFFSLLLFRFWFFESEIQNENQISSHKNQLSAWTNVFLFVFVLSKILAQKQLQYNSSRVNFCYVYASVICKRYFHKNFVTRNSITIVTFLSGFLTARSLLMVLLSIFMNIPMKNWDKKE